MAGHGPCRQYAEEITVEGVLEFQTTIRHTVRLGIRRHVVAKELGWLLWLGSLQHSAESPVQWVL